MTNKYSDCSHCGGRVQERLVPWETHWQDQRYIVEDVPAGVCNRCGEKVLLPHVTAAIDKILQSRGRPLRTHQVPVYQYKSEGVS